MSSSFMCKKTGIHVCLVFFLMPLSFGVIAGQKIFTIKEIPLRAEPLFSADRLEVLSAQQDLTLEKRQGGWYYVKTVNHSKGWVPLLSVKFPSRPFREALSGFFGFTSSVVGARQTTATTGVRGINANDIKSSKADFPALGKMLSYQVDAKTADAFAQAGGLEAQDIREGGQK